MHPLSTFWHRIQHLLFPNLEEAMGPLTERQKRLIAILEMIRIEDFIQRPIVGLPGRPQEDRQAIARAYVAKMVYNIPTNVMLIEQLKNDVNLRWICGWEMRQEVPSTASFSRVFEEFAKMALPAKVHEALIERYESPRLVGHISRDSSAIAGREKPVSKEKAPRPRRRRGRPRKGEKHPKKEMKRLEQQLSGMSLDAMLAELPSACDFGSKKNSKGFGETWRGYKLHVDFADGEIPVSCVLTSASVHDSQVAIPLSIISAKRVQSLYDLMDSAYDAPQIKEYSRMLGHVPIIDHNQRRGEKIEMDPATAQRYNERTTAERGFSQLKDNFGGLMIRVRGHAKVFAHLMFGILALTAAQLLRFIL